MAEILSSPSLNLLRNQLDFTKVPFSDRGSRLLVFVNPEKSNIFIRLAERLASLEADVEAYIRRPPFIHDLTLVDGNGEPLKFETTAYPHMIYFNTEVGEFSLAFWDDETVAFGLPPGKTAGIKFHVSPQFWRVTDQGGEFKFIRNLSYDTNAEIVENQILPEKGGYTVLFIVRPGDDSTIAVNIGDSNTVQKEVPPFSSIGDAAEERWKKWFDQIPPVSDNYVRTYTYAWWVMANNLVQPKGSIVYEAMMPSKVNYVGLWLWDSAMHALAYRHVDPELARNQIRAILEYQLPDGMLPDAVYDEGVISEIDHPIYAEVTKPPILAWAGLKLHETEPDLEFLQDIYVPLVRWNAWWFSMNDDDVDGLVQYNHPYSSGLDDSPLWDYGMPVESPDLNTYLCIQMGSLAIMAELLGMESEAQMWTVMTPFNLYPLWTGQLPDNIRERLIGHLTNPDEFWGENILPSVARNDPHYDPDTMWRGPVWANINYFFIEALRQVGENQLADELTHKTLDLITRQQGIYEYYHSENGKPPAKAAQAFGWTAAVFIDLAISVSPLEQRSQ
jgi:hypothetical protein